ncbi:MAG TPA: hypothetical protein VF493_00725, partial [Terriglobales bacterium]
ELLDKAAIAMTPLRFTSGRIAEGQALDFTRSPIADIRQVAEKDEQLTPEERRQIEQALDGGDRAEAGRLATKYHERADLRRAKHAFADFLNSRILNSLYFSPEVSELLDKAAIAMTPLRFTSGRIAEGQALDFNERRVAAEAVGKLDEASSSLRTQMRLELQSSTSAPNTAVTR